MRRYPNPRAARKPPKPPPAEAARWKKLLVELLKYLWARVTWKSLGAVFIVLPASLYIYREVTRDVLIIDPFTVPKRFEEAGLTGDVIANRIGESLRQIEQTTQTYMKKDNLALQADEGTPLEVEIPGTKLGLKTVIDITRNLFGIYPKHISGGIVLPVMDKENSVVPLPKNLATVSIYVAQGRVRGRATCFTTTADDTDTLVQRTAENVLEQVNPHVFSVYELDHQEYDKAIAVAQRMAEDPLTNRPYKLAALQVWGIALSGQGKQDEAMAKYQESIELDPKYAVAYLDWGNALNDQGKQDEAIAKYQKAIELDHEYAMAYSNWGSALYAQGKLDEATAKYLKAIELDSKFALAYYDWGNTLDAQGKQDEAIVKYRKAIELDYKYEAAYYNLALALARQGKLDEAIAKYQKAIELDPNDKDPYNGWGYALQKQGKQDEAITEYQKAIELDPKFALPYKNWANVLDAEGKHAEAEAKRQQARAIEAKP